MIRLSSTLHAFVSSRIDYCNSLLISLPQPPTSRLRSVLNAAPRLIASLHRYSHISSYIKEHLHWLPISTRIEHKVLLNVALPKWGWHLNISVTPSDFLIPSSSTLPGKAGALCPSDQDNHGHG